MKLFGLDITRSVEAKSTLSLDQFIQRLEMIYQTVSGIKVDAETCLQSPTVQSVVRAISHHLSTCPAHVLLKTTKQGRDVKEPLPNHPVQRLLNRPNESQNRVTYVLDSTSWLLRYGQHFAFKARGITGPIRRLESLIPSAVTPEQDENLRVRYRVTQANGGTRYYDAAQIHHVRLGSKDGLNGVSPVVDGRESIALEIAAERFGSSFFGNGALPSIVFQYAAGSAGHRSEPERQQFIDDFQAKYGARGGRFLALLLPKGVEMSREPITLDNDKAQFLQTRKFIRTVIAGLWGVPPHKVGDLERATFNNVEQQDIDFVQNVVLPYARVFEAAMEHDLLTDDDRAGGVIIRFNLAGELRGDFKTQQEGLKIQREAGVISANDWRERMGMNPIKPEDGGDTYWQQGPSGQNAGAAPKPEPAAAALSGRNGSAR